MNFSQLFSIDSAIANEINKIADIRNNLSNQGASKTRSSYYTQEDLNRDGQIIFQSQYSEIKEVEVIEAEIIEL